MNQRIVERYLKARALAERGEPGERQAARSAMGRMEDAHPGLAAEALRFVASKQAASQVRKDPWDSAAWSRMAADFMTSARDAFAQSVTDTLTEGLASFLDPEPDPMPSRKALLKECFCEVEEDEEEDILILTFEIPTDLVLSGGVEYELAPDVRKWIFKALEEAFNEINDGADDDDGDV